MIMCVCVGGGGGGGGVKLKFARKKQVTTMNRRISTVMYFK